MQGSCADGNVIPMQREWDRIFRAVSYGMYNIEDSHSEVTLSIYNKINNECENYGDFIIV